MFDRETPVASPDAGVSRRDLLRYAGIGAALFGVAPVLAACGSSSGSKSSGPSGGSSSTKKMTNFTIATALGDNYIIDSVNEAQHQFAKHYLDVPKFIYPTSGVQGMQLLAAGAVQTAIQDTALTLASFAGSEAGKRPVIVGMRVPENTYSMVVKGNNWPGDNASYADKMASLKGKTVGVTAVGAGADKMLNLALKAAGMATTDVTHLSIGQLTPAIAQMQAGRIDAYMGYTWTTARFLAQSVGGRVLIDYADPSVPADLSKQQVVVDAVLDSYASAHEDVLKDWLAAMWEAKEWIVANKKAAADILNNGSYDGKAAQISTDYIDHFVNVLVPKFKPMFTVEKTFIDFMVGLGEKAGDLKPGVVTYDQIVPKFARAS